MADCCSEMREGRWVYFVDHWVVVVDSENGHYDLAGFDFEHIDHSVVHRNYLVRYPCLDVHIPVDPVHISHYYSQSTCSPLFSSSPLQPAAQKLYAQPFPLHPSAADF
jgi:hypothetical protein